MKCLNPPSSEADLLERAHSLSGKTLGELALICSTQLPKQLHRAKGQIGRLLEQYLGVSEPNAPEPDFKQWGIELKTVPLNAKGQPKESTYVCTAPLRDALCELTWRESRVYKKLARVLWVPIEASPEIPITERRIISPFLWEMTAEVETILRQDWEELMEDLQLGYLETLSAAQGVYLQLRPKAANRQQLVKSYTQAGNAFLSPPKGFYLRATLTKKIFFEHLRFSAAHFPVESP